MLHELLMKIVQSLFYMNRYMRSFLCKLEDVLCEVCRSWKGRIVEYAWAIRSLELERGRVLDVGSVGSELPMEFASLGYEVYAMDIRKYTLRHPRLDFILGDITKAPFCDNSFDRVTAISTIEHIDLGRYLDLIDTKGDRKAIEEIHRILKKGSEALITLPFGRRCTTYLARVYDVDRLNALFDGFKVKESEYFGVAERIESYNWIPKNSQQLSNVDSSEIARGLCCIKFLKQ
jgi:SAM-dependent methyltransferase